MSQNNWDIDDLLNFDYGKPIPDRASGNKVAAGANSAEKAAYAQLRHSSERASQQHQAAEAQAAAIRAEREKRAAEVARQRAEQHAAEIARRRAEEQARQQSQRAMTDQAAREEYARLRAEAQAKEQARQEALRRQAEEPARQEYLRRQAEAQAEEQARQELLRRQAEEQARQEALRRQAEEQARQEYLRRQAEEQARQEALRRQAEEQARQEALRRQAEEQARQEYLRRQAEEQARQEALRRQAEEQAAARELERRRLEAEAQAEYQRMHEEAEAREMMRRHAEEQARLRYAEEQARQRAAASTADEFVSGLTGEPRTAPVELPDEESRLEVSARRAQKKARDKAAKASKKKRGRAEIANGVAAAGRNLASGGNGGSNKFNKFISILYLIAAAIFSGIILYMDVLPTKFLIAFAVIIVLLSVIILRQINKTRIKKWAKGLSTVMAMLLIFVYGMGSVYAMGTLSFLGSTSVKNENRVASITKEPFNVVMTGIDVRGKVDTQGRSDVNMVVTINPNTETILLTSVPRDYEIRMPDKNYATDKLTHTGFYGVDCTLQSLADLLDIDTNYYVKVNFTSVKVFINLIGGIDVYSDYEFTPVKAPEWTCKKGWNHMNGRQALAFARERKSFLAGDNQRVKNQQLVFEAMLKKATKSNTMVLKYNKVMSYLKDYFEMSFSSREIRSLIKLQIGKSPDWKIYKNTLEGPGATKTTYTGGSQPLYVTEQSPASIAHAQELIKAVHEGKKLKKDEDGNVVVVESTTDENSDN